jgi:hypothetical protein
MSPDAPVTPIFMPLILPDARPGRERAAARTPERVRAAAGDALPVAVRGYRPSSAAKSPSRGAASP